MTRRPDFVRVWAQVEDYLVAALALTPAERVVYLHLLRHTRFCDERVAWVSKGAVARGTHLSVFTARFVLRSLERKGCLRILDRGAAGFKIHPNMDGLPVDAPAYRAAFEVARERDRFIIVHTGCFNVIGYQNQRPADPSLFEPWFARYPEVRVCLAHMNRDHPEEAWEVMRRHDQVWTDTSWQSADSIRRAVDAIGPERIVLGSDWPLLHPDLQGDSLACLERAAGPHLAHIVDASARELLGEV